MYQNLPRSVKDKLVERESRFNGLFLTEQDLDAIIKTSATVFDLNLDLSGAVLNGDGGLFLADAISRYNFYAFINVNLSNTKMSKEGFEAFMYILVDFRNLESLILKQNSLPKEAGIWLAKILGAKGKLQVLDVQDNSLGDMGVAGIAGAFAADLRDIVPNGVPISLLTLQEIDLSANRFGDAAVLTLCRGLTQFGKHVASFGKRAALRVLRLNRNSISDKGAMCLAQLLQTCGSSGFLLFEELSVSENPIGFRGMIALLSTVQEGARTCLQVLGMGRCRPNLSVIDMAALVIAAPSRIRILDISFTEPIAQETSQESGFSDALTRLAAAVATNAELSQLNLGELPEVMRKALTATHIGSAPHQKVRSALDALRSMQDILRLTASLQASIANDLAAPSPTTSTSPQKLEPSHPYTPGLLPHTPGLPSHSHGLRGQSGLQSSSSIGENPSRRTPSSTHAAGSRSLEADRRSLMGTSNQLAASPFASGGNSPSATETALDIQQREFERVQQDHAAMLEKLALELEKLSPNSKAPLLGSNQIPDGYSDIDSVAGSDATGLQYDPFGHTGGGHSSRGVRGLGSNSSKSTVGWDRDRGRDGRHRGEGVDTRSRGNEDGGGQHSQLNQQEFEKDHRQTGRGAATPGAAGSVGRSRGGGEGREFTIDSATLNGIVKSAVQSALEAAQNSWVGSGPSAAAGATSSASTVVASWEGPQDVGEKLTQIIARINVLQDRLQTVEAELLMHQERAVASQGSASAEMSTANDMASNVYRRIRELDGRLGELEMSAGDGRAQQSFERKLAKLEERLGVLESAVESDSETTLQVLNLLLTRATGSSSNPNSAGSSSNPGNLTAPGSGNIKR